MESDVVRKQRPVRLFLLTLFLSTSIAAHAPVSKVWVADRGDGTTYVPVGQQFRARQGKWIGAKIGIFAHGKAAVSEMGYADYDWFRVD